MLILKLAGTAALVDFATTHHIHMTSSPIQFVEFGPRGHSMAMHNMVSFFVWDCGRFVMW